MHELLIALAFVAMVVCPAIVAAVPRNEADDEDEAETRPIVRVMPLRRDAR